MEKTEVSKMNERLRWGLVILGILIIAIGDYYFRFIK